MLFSPSCAFGCYRKIICGKSSGVWLFKPNFSHLYLSLYFQLLNEANVSLSALRQQLNNLEQKPNALWETLSHLQDSADHLEVIHV